MKSYLPILACFFLLVGSCTKSDIAQPAEEEKESSLCNTSAEGTVHQMVLNEDGTDFFYYLQFDNSPTGDKVVFPNSLSKTYQQEGKKVMVNFVKTPDIHTYIVCLAGHQMDPANPDVQSMPIINVCGVEEANF